MKKISICILFLILSYSVNSQQIWKKELEEEAKIIEFLDNDTKLFIAAKEYIYLFNTETGKAIYEIELEDYIDKGLYNLVGNTFLLAPDDETMLAIDALTGKEKWRKQYDDLDQEDFTELHNIGGKPVIQYSSLHIAIDLNTGKLLWGNNFSYNGNISALGGWNYKEFENKGNFMIISPDETANLISASSGYAIGTYTNFEPEESILKAGLQWSYTDRNENYIMFTLDDMLLVIDLKTGREAMRTAMDWDDDIPPFIVVDNGVIVLSEDKIIYFNTANGRNSSISVEVDDFRTYQVFYQGENAYLFAGFKNKLMGIDLNSGKVMWQTKEDDKNFQGYPHRYVELNNGQLLMTYVYGENPPNGCTWIRATGVDAKTGNVNFNTEPLLLTEFYINSFTRAVSSLAADPFGFSKWDNLGFNYYSSMVDDKLVLSLSHRGTTLNPSNREEGGDGIVVVDSKTGKVLLADYNELNDYGSANAKPVNRVESRFLGDKLLVSGNIRSALYNVKNAKRLWITDEYEEKYIVDAAM
ncbi:MAG: PQQ-binding-like beta-propeller repeat protein, partial [Candidatus Kapaibacterium sp.]